jgi:hypothetical protein
VWTQRECLQQVSEDIGPPFWIVTNKHQGKYLCCFISDENFVLDRLRDLKTNKNECKIKSFVEIGKYNYSKRFIEE